MEGRGASYVDYVDEGEELHRSVHDVCRQMEKLGWTVVCRSARGFRYWCNCPIQHQVWIDTAPMTDERLEFLHRRTCLTFN